MKKLFVIGGLLIVLFSLTGCVDCIVGGIVDDTFGWLPGYESAGCSVSSSSSSSSGNQITGNAVQDEDDSDNNFEGGFFGAVRSAIDKFDRDSEEEGVLSGNRIENMDFPEIRGPCGSDPHMHIGVSGCACDNGYRLEGTSCVPDKRECTFDQDCSPSGSDKMVCDGEKYSLRYRCDLRTYKCVPRKGVPAERVDCEAEFGEGYRCYGGSCVRY